METHSLYILKAFSDYDLQITKKKSYNLGKCVDSNMVCLRQLSLSVPQSQ